MSGFAPGDVVVCVDNATPNRAGDFLAHLCLKEGAVYRVSATWIGYKGDPAVALVGVIPPPKMRGFKAWRFRKIDPATDEFTEQMRALRPVRAPLQAGCR